MAWADDLTEVLRDRDHWTFADEVATYRPDPDSWAATVRKPAIPARPAHRWTVSGVRDVVHATGVLDRHPRLSGSPSGGSTPRRVDDMDLEDLSWIPATCASGHPLGPGRHTLSWVSCTCKPGDDGHHVAFCRTHGCPPLAMRPPQCPGPPEQR